MWDNDKEKEEKSLQKTRFIKNGQERKEVEGIYNLMAIYKPTLVDVSKSDSRIRLNLRYEQLVYVMEETHVYVILDIDSLYMYEYLICPTTVL